jgi:hypothetical protein
LAGIRLGHDAERFYGSRPTRTPLPSARCSER